MRSGLQHVTFMTGIIKKKKKDIQSLSKTCGTNLPFTHSVYSCPEQGRLGWVSTREPEIQGRSIAERRSWVLSSLLQSLPHPSSGRCPGSAVPPAMCSLDMGMLSPLCRICVFWAALSVGQCPPFGVMLVPPCSVWDRGSGDGSLLVQRSRLPPGSPAVPGTRTPEPCRGTGRLAAQCGRHGASLASSSQQNG